MAMLPPHASEPPVRRAPALWIDTPAALDRLADAIAGADLVALDTEANSMHAYRERTCTVQITVGGSDAIVDALAFDDLTPLRNAFDRTDLEVVVHGGDYDVTVLTRDHDWRFHRLFDTMIAATLLGEERLGLAALVEDHFGAVLDKRHQRADWARRPLTNDQLAYLQRDTIWLPSLREIYRARIAEAELEEAMAIEMQRLASRRGKPLADDPEGWRRTKGYHRLDARGRAVLEALWRWRDGVAKARDLAPFRVLAPAVMIALAEHPPARPDGSDALRSVPPADARRHGSAIRTALAEGLERYARGEAPPPDEKPRLDDAARLAAKRRRDIDERIRTWRKHEAERRKVSTLAVLPNPAIEWLLDVRPTTVEGLGACSDLGADRIRRYGEKLVSLVHHDDPR